MCLSRKQNSSKTKLFICYEKAAAVVELSSKIRLIALRLQVMLWKLCVMIITFINNWKRWKETAESCANDVRSGCVEKSQESVVSLHRTLDLNVNWIFFEFFYFSHWFEDRTTSFLLSRHRSTVPMLDLNEKGKTPDRRWRKTFSGE